MFNVVDGSYYHNNVVDNSAKISMALYDILQ